MPLLGAPSSHQQRDARGACTLDPSCALPLEPSLFYEPYSNRECPQATSSRRVHEGTASFRCCCSGYRANSAQPLADPQSGFFAAAIAGAFGAAADAVQLDPIERVRLQKRSTLEATGTSSCRHLRAAARYALELPAVARSRKVGTQRRPTPAGATVPESTFRSRLRARTAALGEVAALNSQCLSRNALLQQTLLRYGPRRVRKDSRQRRCSLLLYGAAPGRGVVPSWAVILATVAAWEMQSRARCRASSAADARNDAEGRRRIPLKRSLRCSATQLRSERGVLPTHES